MMLVKIFNDLMRRDKIFIIRNFCDKVLYPPNLTFAGI